MGNLGLWLLLMGLSMNAYAQIHVSDNTNVNVKEGTVFYFADKTFTNLDKETVKIYVGQNTKLTNFPTDAHVEIVYQEKKTQPKKAEEILQQKEKTKLPEQPIAKKDTEPEKKSVLSFTSKGKMPSALFYSEKTAKAALVNTSNFIVKSFPSKKAYSNIIHTLLLNEDNQQIKTSFAGFLPQSQIHLEGKITRPPPILIS